MILGALAGAALVLRLTVLRPQPLPVTVHTTVLPFSSQQLHELLGHVLPGRFARGDPAIPRVPALVGHYLDHTDEVHFPQGTQLLLYTDGLSEARDLRGEFFEPGKALAERSFDGPEKLLDAVLADVQAHTGGASTDDMALLAVQRTPRTS